jgi:hypothetical protein
VKTLIVSARSRSSGDLERGNFFHVSPFLSLYETHKRPMTKDFFVYDGSNTLARNLDLQLRIQVEEQHETEWTG